MDEGVYLASIRSFYRILNGLGESVERRLQAKHVKRSPSVLEATGPDQVWTWDITRIPGPFKGRFFFLYVMIAFTVGMWWVGCSPNGRTPDEPKHSFVRPPASIFKMGKRLRFTMIAVA